MDLVVVKLNTLLSTVSVNEVITFISCGSILSLVKILFLFLGGYGNV